MKGHPGKVALCECGCYRVRHLYGKASQMGPCRDCECPEYARPGGLKYQIKVPARLHEFCPACRGGVHEHGAKRCWCAADPEPNDHCCRCGKDQP